MKNKQSIFADMEKLGRLVIYILIFFYLSQLIWPYLALPDKNIYQSHGDAAQAGFNPLSNSVRYLITLGLTVLGPTFVSLLSKKYQKLIMRTVFILVLGFSFFGLTLVPRVSNPTIDFLHDGERLGNAAEFIKGRHLYTDLVLMHGAFEDPLVAVLSFVTFSRSIGSYYFLLGFLLLASFLLFFVLLSMVIDSELVFYLAGVWFFNLISGSNSLTIFNFSVSHLRDILVWIVLILVWFLLSRSQKIKPLLFTIGFLSSFQFFVSYDRGYYLSFLSLFLVIALRIGYRNFPKSLMIIWGWLAGFIFHLLLVGPKSFVEFLKIAFEQIPKITGYLNEQEIKLVSQHATLQEGLAYWLPFFLVIINGLVIANQLIVPRFFRIIKKESPSPFNSKEFFILTLYIFSVVFFRSALIAVGAYHVNYGSTITYLTSFLILDGLFLRTKKSLLSGKNYQAVKFLICCVALLWILFNLNLLLNFRIKERAWKTAYTNCLFYPKKEEFNSFMAYFGGLFFCPPSRTTKEINDFLKIREVPDEYWIPKSAQNAIAFLNANTSTSDYVFVFSNEGLFYYFLEARSPTRFTNIYIADAAFFRQEVLDDLKKNQPKYILYSSGGSAEVLNDIPMKSRFSDINAWILANYPQKIVFDKIVILSR